MSPLGVIFQVGNITDREYQKLEILSSNINVVIKEICNLFIFLYEEILTYKNIKKKVHKQTYA